jgi:hypothetical protein
MVAVNSLSAFGGEDSVEGDAFFVTNAGGKFGRAASEKVGLPEMLMLWIPRIRPPVFCDAEALHAASTQVYIAKVPLSIAN